VVDESVESNYGTFYTTFTLRQGDAEKKRKVRPRLSRPLRFIK